MTLSLELSAKLEGGSQKPAACFSHSGLDFPSVTGRSTFTQCGQAGDWRGLQLLVSIPEEQRDEGKQDFSKKQRGFGVPPYLYSFRSGLEAATLSVLMVSVSVNWRQSWSLYTRLY